MDLSEMGHFHCPAPPVFSGILRGREVEMGPDSGSEEMVL